MTTTMIITAAKLYEVYYYIRYKTPHLFLPVFQFGIGKEAYIGI